MTNMQINNPFQMNDWEIKKFLKVILSIQFAMWGAIGLDATGLQIPIIRQLIGFIYLIFIPGILILRILKLHKLGNIEAILYTVGLSLATLMFTGFFMNMVYPLFSISRPISFMPLIITISAVVLVLCILCYVRDKDFSDPGFINFGDVLSPPVLFLCLIPFLAILGTYFVNFHHNNIFLMLMIIVIALVVLLIAFDRFIPKKLYPLAIFIIAISLIYHLSLISMYINDHDTAIIYRFLKLIFIKSAWDWTFYHNYNATLSTVMLIPIFYRICAIDMVWILKIIYPLLCSFVPLGLYSIFQKMTNGKIAFLSAFFLVSYMKFPGYDQLIAEIFFVLLIMLIINKNMGSIKKSVLSVIFAISLVVSHYGLSYLVMFMLIFVMLLFFLTENQAIKRLWERFYYFISKGKEKIIDNSNVKYKSISINFVLLYTVFVITWYMYTSSSSAFNTLIHIGDHIANTIFTEFLSPESARGMEILMKERPSLLKDIHKFFLLATVFFICVGILKLLLKHKEMKCEREYVGFSLYWFIICLAAVAIPHFAEMDPYRLFRLSLFLLAPFSIIGGITIFNVIAKVFRMRWTNKNIKRSLRVSYVFFIILLLFNTGFIYEIANDYPSSISLSQESIKKCEDLHYKALLYIKVMPEHDVFSARWLSMEMNNDEKIYASYVVGERALCAYSMIPRQKIRMFTNTTKHIGEGSYIYLSALNVVGGIGRGLNPKLKSPTYFSMSDIHPLLTDKDKIYTNGGSEIYN